MVQVQAIATSGVCLTIGLCILISTVAVQSIRADDWEQDSNEESEATDATALEASELDYDDEADSGEYSARDDCEGHTCALRNRCGRAVLNPLSSRPFRRNTPLILNGENQKYGEWPSFATIESTFADGMVSRCGGVLVTFDQVLTAAHCVFRKEAGMTQTMVMLGDHDTESADSHERVAPVRFVCSTKQYLTGPKSSELDWVVLYLQTGFSPSDYIQPACLPYGYNQYKQYKHCHLIGAGVVDAKTNASARIIQKLPVREVPCAELDEMYVSEKKVCYTKAMGQGAACHGDSGGPVLCLDSDTWTWTVVAVLNNGKCDKGNWVSAYAKISYWLPKIKELCYL